MSPASPNLLTDDELDYWDRALTSDDPHRRMPVEIQARLLTALRESRKHDEEMREGLAWIDSIVENAACAFCAPPRTIGLVAINKAKEHMRACQKHPLGEAEARAAKYERMLECAGCGGALLGPLKCASCLNGGGRPMTVGDVAGRGMSLAEMERRIADGHPKDPYWFHEDMERMIAALRKVETERDQYKRLAALLDGGCEHPPFACRVEGKCECSCSMCIQPGEDPRPVRR